MVRVIAVNREKFVVLAGNKVECAVGKDNVELTERVLLPQRPFRKVSESLGIISYLWQCTLQSLQ